MEETRRPIYDLVIISLLLVLHEMSKLCFGHGSCGMEAYIDDKLFTHASPLLLLLVLGIRQLYDSWTVSRDLLLLIVSEGFIYTMCIIIVSQLCCCLLSTASSMHIGVGIYEEFVFRLIGVLFLCSLLPKKVHWLVIFVSSVLFSLAHYLQRFDLPLHANFYYGCINLYANSELYYGAMYRFLFGVFAGIICIKRGFSVVVIVHIVHNVFVTNMNQ